MLIIGFAVTEVLLSTLVFTSETCGNHAAHRLTKQTASSHFSSFRCSPSVRNTSTAVPLVANYRGQQGAGRDSGPAGGPGPAVTRLGLHFSSRLAEQRPGVSSQVNLDAGVGQRV